MRVRNLVLKIHFYGGLVSFWYLIVLGISSLHFNHHFSFMDQHDQPTTWTRRIMISNPSRDDLTLSETIRDSLSLIGWPLPWETWRDSTMTFHFTLEQPAKRYVIDYSLTSQVARVQETQKGFWAVFNSLHASGGVPNAPFLRVWSWYTRLTVISVVFSIISGIYIWVCGDRDKKSGLYTLIISLTIAILWMIQLYVKG